VAGSGAVRPRGRFFRALKRRAAARDLLAQDAERAPRDQPADVLLAVLEGRGGVGPGERTIGGEDDGLLGLRVWPVEVGVEAAAGLEEAGQEVQVPAAELEILVDPEEAADHRVDGVEEGFQPLAVGDVDIGAVGRRDQPGDLQRQRAVVGAEIGIHVAAEQLAEIAAAAPHLHHPAPLQGVAVGVEGDRPAVAEP
jgi:hypothetical protein